MHCVRGQSVLFRWQSNAPRRVGDVPADTGTRRRTTDCRRVSSCRRRKHVREINRRYVVVVVVVVVSSAVKRVEFV